MRHSPEESSLTPEERSPVPSISPSLPCIPHITKKTSPAPLPPKADHEPPLCNNAHTPPGGPEPVRPDPATETPPLTPPSREPDRHWRFGDEGITGDIVEARRPS